MLTATTAITLLSFKTFARSKTAYTKLKELPLLFDFPGVNSYTAEGFFPALIAVCMKKKGRKYFKISSIYKARILALALILVLTSQIYYNRYLIKYTNKYIDSSYSD